MTQAMTCHDPHRSGEVLIEVLDVLLSIGVGSIASKKNMTNPLGRGISETISISNMHRGYMDLTERLHELEQELAQ